MQEELDLVTTIEIKEEIMEEMEAMDSDMNTTLELLRQQKEKLLVSRVDGSYNKAQGEYIIASISKLAIVHSNVPLAALEGLNNVIASLCKEVIGLRYRDKTNTIMMEGLKHSKVQQQQELNALASSLAHTQKEHQKKLEVERKVIQL